MLPLAAFFSFFSLYDSAIVKTLILIYFIFATFSLDAKYYPSVILLSAFMGNSVIALFFLPIILITKYNHIKNKKLAPEFIVLFLLYIITIYYVILIYKNEGVSLGLSLSKFELFYSFFLFIYGVVISQTFTNETLDKLFKSLIIYALIQFIFSYFGLFTSRLIFFVIPFVYVYFFYILFIKRQFSLNFSSLIGLFYILAVPMIFGMTFTLSFTIISACVVSYGFFNNNILKRFIGFKFLIVVSTIFIYSIYLNVSTDFILYNANDSFDNLLDRFHFKLFVDRGVLWGSVFLDQYTNYSFFPTIEQRHIYIKTYELNEIQFDFHSHNVFLELIRTNGLFFATVLSIIFLSFFKKSLIFLNKSALFNPKLYLLSSVAVVSFVIGSFTGIFVFLTQYSFMGISILGVLYGLSLHDSKRSNY